MAARGRLLVGTSGYSYATWIPGFYPPGTRPSEMLASYARRLSAVELNNTFYQRPSPATVAGWLAATPSGFRFVVKAQRGITYRARVKAPGWVEWQTERIRLFGSRLGCVLVKTPDNLHRDVSYLEDFLRAWPADLPVTFDFRHPSWLDDRVVAVLARHGAALCASDVDAEPEPPPLVLTARFLYVRLRRATYDERELDAWAARLDPFLADGRDVFAFFKHEESPTAPALALMFLERFGAVARA